ncbi:hypothetical protein PF005_g8087 [Phytophthora fragariae]|uniref:EF-hand domain-containing protein n=1 Tax=Phytophthora fragariae TaxID=53985 RepID=A0A6A3YJD9_9STRA|nr:hypothetical protein PF003_g6698 [Phytophthora fragariae]KAE9125642.1 hypothetical protein PF007_g6277 [Phytophthora fragariae]KAE9218879.1 hypothetical protein PF005_g8087 [Phytophthora fragariae]
MLSVVDEAAQELKLELNHDTDKSSEVLVATTTDECQEVDDAVELALLKAMQARRFEGLEDLRNTLLATTQLTTSNVISTVVTALPHRVTRRKRSKLSTPPMSGPGSNQEPRETVYGAPKSMSARLSKGRRGSSPHQAQLPTFRRSLPALAIPAARLHRELLLERDAFMAQLAREREEKAQLECWAATRIQACYRGFTSRPRAVAYARRRNKLALRSVSCIRLDLVEMQERLRLRGNLPEEGGTGGKEMPMLWRQGVKDRARRKRDVKNRHEERQMAATRIQSCVRRFLAKIAYGHIVARARDERYLLAIVKIQSAFRGYSLRAWIQRLVPKLQYNAAVQIQALVRGSQARERASMLWFERMCEERRRAGLPFQLTLGSRVSIAHPNGTRLPTTVSDSPRTSLRGLYENRKSRASLEFKTAKWQEQRSFLRIFNVAQKLAARRARLVHRWNWTKTVVLDKRRQKRVKRMISAMSSSMASTTTRGSTQSSSSRTNVRNSWRSSTSRSASVELVPTSGVERPNSFRSSSQGSASPVNSSDHPTTSAANKIVKPLSLSGDNLLHVASIGSSQESDDVAWSNTLGADDTADDFSIRDPHFDLTTAKMTKLFSLCSPDDNEMLSYDGFRSGLEAMGIACDSDEQFQAFVDVVDDNKSGTISYEEFLSAIQEIKLAQLFNDAFVRTMPPLYASVKSRSEPATLGSIEYSPDRIRSVYPINHIKSFIYSTKPTWATVRWINVEGLHTLLVRRLSVRYRLHPLAVEDTLGLRVKRPKYVNLEMVTAYQNMYRASLLVLPEDDSPFDLMDQGELESRLRQLEIGHVMTVPEQLSLFVMKGVLISVQTAGTTCSTLWSALKQRLSISYSKVRQHSTAFLVYSIMDACVNELSPISQTFGAKLVMLERLMLLEPRYFDLGRIANCSKQVKALQMHCKPLFEIISKLVASDDYTGETLQYFADVQDHLTTIEEECEQHLDRCLSLVDDFNNARAAQQNDASYILALIAAIFLPAQFLTGVYGMNFPYIPETTYHYAYFIWWAVMLVVAALIVLLFKIKKWL